jgi:hypothetical protein
MKKMKYLCLSTILIICTLLTASCRTAAPQDAETPAADRPTKPLHEQPDTEDYMSPLYLSVVVHVEEDTGANNTPKNNVPDYDGSKQIFDHFSNAMSGFAVIASSHGAKINFGTEWTFADGVKNYRPSFFSVLESIGHSIDAHAHESHIDYHEVRASIAEAGGSPTSVASGMREDNIYQEMAYFDILYPEFQILWGVASAGHGEGEPVAGWVWRPSGTNWEQHDPGGNYINIGGGEGVNSVEAVKAAVANRENGRINTYSVFLNPRHFKAEKGTAGIPETWTTTKKSCDYWVNRLAWWDDFFDEIDSLTAQGNIVYASLTEVAGIFVENEGSLSFPPGTIPRSTIPATQRNIQAGYCLPK